MVFNARVSLVDRVGRERDRMLTQKDFGVAIEQTPIKQSWKTQNSRTGEAIGVRHRKLSVR
ncbi:hypothetical protein POG22_12225 [Geitlerinema sp. CS-897]|nr:hypothetical protein [Geitlerinema sp. CS-897]